MKATLASSISLAALAASSFAGDKDCGKVVIENPCSFYVQAVGGASFFVTGDLLDAVDLGDGNRINKVGFDDAYDNASTYGLRVGRACERGRIYLGFEYTEASAGTVEMGNTMEVGGIPVPDDPIIMGNFGDYSDYALVLGVERNLFRGNCDPKNPVGLSRLRPWVGAQIGIRFVDGISATTHLLDLGGQAIPGSGATMELYDDSVVFTAAFTLGLAYDLTDRITIGVETGLRYQTALDDVDDDLGPMGFGSANDDGDLLAVPVLGTVAIKF